MKRNEEEYYIIFLLLSQSKRKLNSFRWRIDYRRELTFWQTYTQRNGRGKKERQHECMVRLRCVYISLHILLYKTIERNRFFFFFCNISGAADLIDGIDASKCIYEYCVIKASSNLSSSRPSKIYMLGCIVVETSFIKLNIVRSASDNQQKYIYIYRAI